LVESKELHQKIDEIRQRVESMDNFMPWLVRPQAKQIRELMLEYFMKHKAAARVYLAIDGDRNVNQIADDLKMKGPNVSREITILSEEMGLIERKVFERGIIYQRTKIDKVIGLSRALSKRLSRE
jgi:hypothetical protein